MNDFTFHTPETASDDGRDILNQVKNSYGFIPNLFGYMAEAPATVEAYVVMTKLLDKISLSAQQSQVALLAISQENECGFCTVAHRAVGKMKGVRQDTLDALHNQSEIPDPSDRALAEFAKTLVKKSGWLDDEDLQAFYSAGFTRQQVFEVILISAIKTLSNYSNHLTKPEPNPELLAIL